MKVSELIEKLNGLPKDAAITLYVIDAFCRNCDCKPGNIIGNLTEVNQLRSPAWDEDKIFLEGSGEIS